MAVATWLIVMFAGSAAVRPGVDFEEPVVMIFGALLYGILANIASTAGPIFDLLLFRASARRQLFKADYVASMFVTALPGLWAVIAWVSTLVSGKKPD